MRTRLVKEGYLEKKGPFSGWKRRYGRERQRETERYRVRALRLI